MTAQRGIQSIEVGGRLLQALARVGRPMALKDIAAAAGMAPAKAHPYLVSFGKLGLIAQDAASARYGLGPLALQIGLISLQQVDPLRLATEQLPALAQALGQTVGITVWGERGATVVRTEEAPSPVHVTMRHGAVMSLRGTASGRLFAAHLPRAVVRVAWRAETGRAGFDAAFVADLAAIRASGVSHVVDKAVVGVSGLAAPVFDGSGQMVLALTAIGATAGFDVRPLGVAARALRRCAQALSAQLGSDLGRVANQTPVKDA
ncbi:MAG: IclR family transcriptional regulator [Ideonella sp. WA131b]|jgi:DNA-binding IclR family transcriptional regulator|nr:IclR family transcriptional regulator [Ideonella sp. WA131b]